MATRKLPRWLGLVFALGLPHSADAQSVIVAAESLACLPPGENSVAVAVVSPDVEGNIVRLYFRRQEHGDFYYVPMARGIKGSYWAVLPKPQPETQAVEYHISVEDGRQVVFASSPSTLAPVLANCAAHLSSAQQALTTDLTIGETNRDQEGKTVAWFRCDGIRHRIDASGRVGPHEACTSPYPLASIADVGPGLIAGTPPPPPSPSRPPR